MEAAADDGKGEVEAGSDEEVEASIDDALNPQEGAKKRAANFKASQKKRSVGKLSEEDKKKIKGKKQDSKKSGDRKGDRKTSAVIGETLWQAQKDALLTSQSLEEMTEELERKRQAELERKTKEDRRKVKAERKRKKAEAEEKKRRQELGDEEQNRRRKEEEDELNAAAAKKKMQKKKKREAAIRTVREYFAQGIQVTKHCRNGKTKDRVIFLNDDQYWYWRQKKGQLTKVDLTQATVTAGPSARLADKGLQDGESEQDPAFLHVVESENVINFRTLDLEAAGSKKRNEIVEKLKSLQEHCGSISGARPPDASATTETKDDETLADGSESGSESS